jgi:hypothetical protein
LSGILRRRPSPALVISLIALFVSLGGVSYGVATGFIDGREIRNNTIRTQDLRNNDVRGRDIRNSTIRTRDVGFNALTGNDIKESELATVPRAATLAGQGPSAFLRYASTIPSGVTVRGAFGGSATPTGGQVVSFPLPAPADLTDAQVSFPPASQGLNTEEDVRCSGDTAVPMAPPGTVCLYPIDGGADALSGTALGQGIESRYGFRVDQMGAGDFSGTWAYTAP